MGILKLRLKKGLTQKQLADRLDMTETALANWERGRSGKKMFERFAILCNLLECSPKDLIGEE